ncbi:MAG: methylenetetrahydrofolate reductase [Candidatus Thermoplasmatota archaeon]
MSRRPPLLFEALPPQVDSSEAQWQDHLDLLEPLKRAGLAGINVPEIVNGHYKTVDPRSFAAALQRRLSVRALLNRITVHHTVPQLQAWAAETRLSTGIHDLVFVGGERSVQAYPGSPVLPALRGLRESVTRAGGNLGVITIPTRRRPDLDEPQRLLQKQDAGADFAISQILCEPDAALRLQSDLAHASPQTRKPLTLFWSLAPVARKRDLEFLNWLGVDVPDAVRKDLLAVDPAHRVARSHDLNVAIARRLLESAEAENAGPIGFCIEHVMLSNIEAAIDLVDRVRSLAREFKSAPAAFATVW